MQDFSPIKNRILEYLNEKGISQSSCYKDTGITRGVLSQKNGISEDNLSRFLDTYQDINIEWLLTGYGNMLLSNKPKTYTIENVSRTLNEQDVPYHKEMSIDDERRTLIDSINKMTETADRNSITLAKIVDYLVSKDVNVE